MGGKDTGDESGGKKLDDVPGEGGKDTEEEPEEAKKNHCTNNGCVSNFFSSSVKFLLQPVSKKDKDNKIRNNLNISY